MTLNKNEKRMIIVLVGIVYAFSLMKFSVMPNKPKIESALVELREVNFKKETLDNDYENIDDYRIILMTTETKEERLSEYIADSSDMTNSLNYMDKISYLFNQSIESIGIGAPTKEDIGNTTYYGFPIKFTSILTYEEIENVISYVEGSAKRVSIDTLTMVPVKSVMLKEVDLPVEQDTLEESDTFAESNQEEQFFTTTMTLSFYSINEKTIDQMYNYGMNHFNSYRDRNDVPIFIEDIDKASDEFIMTQGIKSQDADIVIFHKDYLIGGNNFEVYGTSNSSDRVRLTTKKSIDLHIRLTQTTYSIDVDDANGQVGSTFGRLSDDNIILYVESIIGDATENDNLKVNVFIENESGKELLIKVKEVGGGVVLFDRAGQIIDVISKKENARII